jgi:hypothetical protein
MDLLKIDEYPTPQNLLLNKRWKETDYYELCCKNELWGCAFLVVIDKQVTANANEAILYMLERLIIEHESWDEAIQSDIDTKSFITFTVAGGYISSYQGKDISVQEFWNNYEEIQNGIYNVPNFEITKNGHKFQGNPLNENDIVHAVCFCDNWNNRQYFFECNEKWGFFSWSTGA